ncbi:MAG: hypothetical protein HY746_07995 [Elusimicrobia bacterium]|nr:hypothetical protein [Elusimicrobiota bacterium]
MRKTITALFVVVMAIASYVSADVSAEEVKIDFNTGGNSGISIMENIERFPAVTNPLIPDVQTARQYYYTDMPLMSSVNGIFEQVSKCDAYSCVSGACSSTCTSETAIQGMIAKGAIKDEILKEIIRWYLLVNSNPDRYAIGLLEQSDTQILFNEENVYIITKDNNVNPYTIKDKILVNTLKSALPAKIMQTKQTVQVCELVEVILIHYLWKVIDGVWKQVWVETKKLVNQCRNEEVPTDTGNSAGSGSTYHNGQGGDSNYDVNKAK